ncbi:unnamed protein product [Amoebophrya sp. A25]|nr:unnamed protein product [Amoebophrya sp. A25]|eukprot:GSA25T00025794001.1
MSAEQKMQGSRPVDWEPRHAFLSVHPYEMAQAFINLVDPREAKKKLEHLFFGAGGYSGIMFFAVSLLLLAVLKLQTRKWKMKQEKPEGKKTK